MADSLARYKKMFSEAVSSSGCPVFLLRGREEFIMNQLSESIISAAVDENLRSFNLTVEYAGQTDLSDFVSNAGSYPFMADRKVLVLRELENLKGSCDTLTEYCRNPSQSSIVLIIHNTHNELGRRNRQPRGYGRLEKAVEANGKVYQFKKLSEKDTVRWIRQRCRKMDMTISADAAAAMMRSIGDNLYNIMNELKKIHIVYEGEEVGMEDIEKIIGRYRLNAVFDLNDSLIPGNERESLKILLRILNSGAENPSVLIYNLIRHFLDLLKIKSGYRAGGYWYRKLKKQADSFDRREILLWLENLRVADLDIKSSLLPDEAVIINCFMNSINGKLYGKTGKHFVMRAG